MKSPYYITTPIYYPNSQPHIGTVYTTLCCDVIARFLRLDGHEVKFLTGTDEHGQKIAQTALKAEKDPQEFVDQMAEEFKKIISLYNFSCDDFIRTTEARHKKAVQKLWTILEKNNQIYLGSYAGWYAMRDETFYTESELVDGKAPTGADVEWIEESSYYFKLSEWGDKLLTYYAENPDFIAPQSRYKEVVQFVKSGLRDLSISRTSFKWGIPVPNHPEHIVYVWVDALTNYISALNWAEEKDQEYETFWPANIHVVGKDILRFHAVYWPALLMAAGLPLPKRIFAHGWWINKGNKISKSLGNAINPNDLADQYGIDAIRYFLIREIPFGNDGDFSEDALISRSNSQLANELGNLVQRTLTMIHKNCDRKVPDCLNAPANDEDNFLITNAQNLLESLRPLVIQDQALHKYCESIWKVVGQANKYMDTQAPWILRKTDPKRMEKVLYTVAETLRYIGILIQPLMPESSGKILDQLGVPNDQRTFDHCTVDYSLKPGTLLPEPSPIFQKFLSAASKSESHD